MRGGGPEGAHGPGSQLEPPMSGRGSGGRAKLSPPASAQPPGERGRTNSGPGSWLGGPEGRTPQPFPFERRLFPEAAFPVSASASSPIRSVSAQKTNGTANFPTMSKK